MRVLYDVPKRPIEESPPSWRILTAGDHPVKMVASVNPPPERVSLRDLAKRLGLTHATVSMALRGLPRVAEKTRRRILEEAERCGYRPDPMLSALAAYRQNKRVPSYHGHLAWLHNYDFPASRLSQTLLHQNPYFMGAHHRAAELGFQIEPYSFRDVSPDQLSAILNARGVRGILVSPLDHPGTCLAMDWEKFSAVAFGFSLASPRLHTIISAQYRIALIATRKLHKLGYKRVGFLTSSAFDERTDRNFVSGFLSASMDVPAAHQIPPLSLKEDDPEPAISAAIKKWIVGSGVEAVLCSNSFLPFVAGTGLAIPDDVAVALIGTPNRFPGFAGMDENCFRVGALAVEHLAFMIQHGERGLPEIPCYILVDGTWVDGASAPPQAGKIRPVRPATARAAASSKKQ